MLAASGCPPISKRRTRRERTPPRLPASELIAGLRSAIDSALGGSRACRLRYLRAANGGPRGAPDHVIGLMFHAAEHSQRHAGQLVTTAKIIRARAG